MHLILRKLGKPEQLIGWKREDFHLNCNFFFSSFFVSCEVAQFINLSVQECRAILDRYAEEQNREIQKIKQK